jgi:hypothetical protein
MGRVIVLLAVPESPLAGEMAAILDSGEVSHYTCSLDGPIEGKPLTVSPNGVIWEGVDLLRADAIFVERPVFPWPQHELPPERFCRNGNFKQGVVFQREAMSLIVSAVRIAGDARRMINPPGAAHLAISPSIALDRLTRQGLPVHPWCLETYTANVFSNAGFVIDASGADRRHSPMLPREDEPVIIYEPFSEEVVTVLVVGGRAAGALWYRSCEQWAIQNRLNTSGERQMQNDMDAGADSHRVIDLLEVFPKEVELAVRAAAALELDIAAVSIRAGSSPASVTPESAASADAVPDDAIPSSSVPTGAAPTDATSAGATPAGASAPHVLLCEAGPDLAAWNRALQGRLAGKLAEYLLFTASA